MTPPQLLAEIWAVEGGDFHLRIEMDAFMRDILSFSGTDKMLEEGARYAMIEILRHIVKKHDEGEATHVSDDGLPDA